MRDRLIHYYYGVDEKILWDTAKYDIPILHKQIIQVIEKEGKDIKATERK